jgi:hypothetical protein
VRPAPLATALGDWQPQVAAGSEQQAPVAGFGVGSPQHADAVAVVPDEADTFTWLPCCHSSWRRWRPQGAKESGSWRSPH